MAKGKRSSKKALMSCSNYWTSPFQVGSHHLARGLVKAGWQVAFVSAPISPLHLLQRTASDFNYRFPLYQKGGLTSMEGRLWAYAPGALFTHCDYPLLRSSWLLKNWHKLSLPNIVRKVCNEGYGDVDLLYFDNSAQSFWLHSINWDRSVYRIVDNNQHFPGLSNAHHVAEKELASRVDLTAYTAKALEGYATELGAKKCLYLPNGVDVARFSEKHLQLPQEYENISKPIAVYVGALEELFDFGLLNDAAAKLPNVSFVLIGPDSYARKRVTVRSNVHILGRRNHSDLSGYLQHADVGIIPFDVKNHSELIDAVNPLKLYEYFASGLPVVSVLWKELELINSPAVLCRTTDDFVNGISKALSGNVSPDLLAQYACRHDWSKRVDQLLTALL